MRASSSQSLPVDRILGVIDASPETRGMGCYVMVDGHATKLRDPGSRYSSVVIELRPNAQQAGGRTPFSSATGEWLSWGLNCTGMVLAWVGVAGTVTVAPVTGGTSLVGSAFLYGGAVAATAQCSVATYRISNVLNDNEWANEALDRDKSYVWAMRALDGVSLVGAGGAIKEVVETRAALKEADVAVGDAIGALNRHDRMLLTDALKLQGGRRVAAVSINNVVKLRLLDGVGAVLATAGSAKDTGGVIHDVGAGVHDVVIWVVSADP
jgi:hypothetical protein